MKGVQYRVQALDLWCWIHGFKFKIKTVSGPYYTMQVNEYIRLRCRFQPCQKWRARFSNAQFWQILEIGAFCDAGSCAKNNEETRLQTTHVPGTRFQQLKGQKSKTETTSKTHSMTHRHGKVLYL